VIDLKDRFTELDRMPAPDLDRLIAARARQLAKVPGALGSEDAGARRAGTRPVELLATVAILALAVGVAALMQWRLMSPSRQVRPSPSPTPTSLVQAPSAGTVLFSGSACAYKGPPRIWVDHVSVALSNQTARDAHFDFLRLNQGHSYLEFAAHIREEQQRSQAGQSSLGYPDFATFLFTDVIKPQETQSLYLPTDVATYVIACIPWNDSQPAGIFAAGPVTVSP